MKILNKIQRELNAPKGQRNNFGNYNYRSCEDILKAVKPLLDNSILTLNDEIVMIGERYYIKATATLRSGNDCVHTASAYAREPLNKKGMDESQITGAASSYARKYALNGLFCIDDLLKSFDKDCNKDISQWFRRNRQNNILNINTHTHCIELLLSESFCEISDMQNVDNTYVLMHYLFYGAVLESLEYSDYQVRLYFRYNMNLLQSDLALDISKELEQHKRSLENEQF